MRKLQIEVKKHRAQGGEWGGARIPSWEPDSRPYAHKHSLDKTVNGLGLHVS